MNSIKLNNIYLTCLNSGFLPRNLAKTFLNASENQLDYLVKKNVLTKNRAIIFSKVNTYYTLSPNMLKLFRSRKFYIYKSDSSQLEHDYVLSRLFLEASDYNKMSWKNETELKKIYGKNTTTSDGLFITKNKKIIGVEVLTSTYTPDYIEKKKIFLENNCDDYILINVNDIIK